MSEKMTDEQFEGRVIGCMSLVERDLLLLPEARRARASEAEKERRLQEQAQEIERLKDERDEHADIRFEGAEVIKKLRAELERLKADLELAVRKRSALRRRR